MAQASGSLRRSLAATVFTAAALALLPATAHALPGVAGQAAPAATPVANTVNCSNMADISDAVKNRDLDLISYLPVKLIIRANHLGDVQSIACAPAVLPPFR